MRGASISAHLQPATVSPLNVLITNAGSSTLKFQVVRNDAERTAANEDEKHAEGTIERIGGEEVYTL